MKAARPLHSDLSSNRRAQPIRQTRNNPPRSSGLLPRSFSARDPSGSGLGHGQSPEQRTKIYPAITYFADAITALPKELVRHLTLLKEVDAKIFAPEEALLQRIDAALNFSPTAPRQQQEHAQLLGPTPAHNGASMSANGVVMNGHNDSILSAPDAGDNHDGTTAARDPANIPRRQLLGHCAITMAEMLVSLEEKNHLISSATEALNKQLARLDDCFPYLEQEISEEARYGSDKHWAYTETRSSKPAEKSRRDIGSQIANGHALSADDAAARSESRKQAMLAKKGRIHPIESDFDDHLDHRHKGELTKKPHGNSKKTRPANVTTNVGLGVANGTGANGNNPPSKRRKVEKAPNGGVVMERSMNAVPSNNGAVSKGKIVSPTETPTPEGSKRKSKGSITTNGHARKRYVVFDVYCAHNWLNPMFRTAVAISNPISPSMASFPINSTFADSKSQGRVSPVPTNGGKPVTVRARQNSIQSAMDNAKARPSSSSSNKPNGTTIGTPELGSITGVTGRSATEVKTSVKESAVNPKSEHASEDRDEDAPETRGALGVGGRKEPAMKREEAEVNGTTIPPAINTAITTTKSGRASKPSTPALQSFPEPVRSRSSRIVVEQTGSSKRSHKKGAGHAAQLMAAQNNADDEASRGQSDEEDAEIDADEQTYCFCNGVSYGEMVACDADGCSKEWFHLDCVGLKVAPKGNGKHFFFLTQLFLSP